MNLHRFLFALFLFFSFFYHSTYAEESFSAPFKHPSSFHPISGDYVISELDLVAHGYEPLYFTRVYISGMQEGRGSDWIFFPHLYLYIERGEGKKKPTILTVCEPDGMRLRYKNLVADKGKNKSEFFPIFDEKNKGSSNAHQGEPTPQLNLTHYHITKNSFLGCYILKTPDGGLRYYKKVSETGFAYLEKEKKPNGNWIHYTYNKEYYTLSEVYSTNPKGTKTYAKATFSYENPNPSRNKNFSIHTSTGDSVHYTFEVEKIKKDKQTQRFFKLKLITKSDGCYEELAYDRIPSTKTSVVHKRFLNGQEMERVSFYQKETNFIGETQVSLLKENDPAEKRILSFSQPLGENGSFVNTQTFFYNLGKFAKEDSKKYSPYLRNPDAITVSYDVENKKTEYGFNSFFLPLHTCRFGRSLKTPLEGKDNLLVKELYFWHHDGSLYKLHTYSMQEEGRTLYSKHYDYNDKGQVIKERLYGNLTGTSNCSIPLNKKESRLPCENLEIKKTYHSPDSFLISEESFEFGLSYRYEYLKGTHLPQAKYTLGHGKILCREFYEYNEDNVLIAFIQDNGSDFDKNNLTHATQRTLRSIHLSNNSSSLNYPHIIEEKFFDFEKQQYTLFTKKVLSYSSLGMLLEEKLYDSKETLITSTRYQYDIKRNLSSLEDSLGRVSTYSYDSFGNLIEEHNAITNERIFYKRDLQGHPLSVTIKSTNGSEKTSLYLYDLKGRLIQEKDIYGNVTDYQYNDLDHEVGKILPVSVDASGKTLRAHIKTLKNAFGYPTQITDPLGNITRYTYTAHHKPLSIEHPDGSYERFSYRKDGALVSHLLRNGHEERFTCDPLGRTTRRLLLSKEKKVLEEESFIYDGLHLLEHLDEKGVKTTYRYDGLGRNNEIYKTKNNEFISRESFSYDALGKKTRRSLTSYSQDAGSSFTWVYDSAGRLTQQTEEDLQGHVFSKKTFHYSSSDALIAIILDDNSGHHRFTYDSKQREISHIDPLGRTITKHYTDDLYNAQTSSYESEVLSILSNGLQIKEHFNSLGQLISKSYLTSLGELLSQETFAYDLLGNVIQETSAYYKEGSLENRKVVEKTLDCMNQLVSLKESFDGVLEKTTYFSYNIDGLQTKIIYADKTSIDCVYNDLNQLESLKSSDGSIHYSFSYDSMGRVIQETDEISKRRTLREYNTCGDLIKETLGNGLTLCKDFDTLGRVIKLTLPDLSSVHYDYDSFHLKEMVRLSAEEEVLYSHQYLEYNQQHLPTVQATSLGSYSLQKQYDLLGRTVEIQTPYHQQKITEFHTSGAPLDIETKTPSNFYKDHYSYDSLDQLIEEKGSFSHRYSYDSRLNRLEKDTSSYTINSQNQLLSDGSATYEYTALGAPYKKRSKTKTLLYTFDALQRLTSLKTDKIEMEFTYDFSNRRLSKTVRKKNFFGEWQVYDQELYLYDGLEEIGALNKDHQIKELRILGNSSSEIGSAIAIEINSKPYIPLHDLFGNIIALFDTKNEWIAESYRYSAFGESALYNSYQFKTEFSSVGNKWRYQSKRLDEESGLIFFGYRYYDPSTGRWLTPDPVGSVDSSNLYQYVFNNPLSNIDLYGLSTESREDEEFDLRSRTQVQPYSTQEEKPYLYNPMMTAPPGCYLGKEIPNLVKQPYYSPYLDTKEDYPRRVDLQPVFINGIDTTRSEAWAMRTACSNNLGFNVDLFYNETQGRFKDIQAVKQYHKRIDTELVTGFRNYLSDQIDQGKNVLIFAHSCGGLITHNAVEKLDPSYRKKIRIVTFGSAKYIPKFFGASVKNYVSKRDLVSIGSNLWHLCCNVLHPSIRDPRHLDMEIRYLTPTYLSIPKEHAFMGSTYQKALVDVSFKINEELQK